MKHVADFYVPWRGGTLLRHREARASGSRLLLADNEAYFKRGNFYGYFDDGER